MEQCIKSFTNQNRQNLYAFKFPTSGFIAGDTLADNDSFDRFNRNSGDSFPATCVLRKELIVGNIQLSYLRQLHERKTMKNMRSVNFDFMFFGLQKMKTST